MSMASHRIFQREISESSLVKLQTSIFDHPVGMEIKRVYVKTRTQFGKHCIFDVRGPQMDTIIHPNPTDMNDYIKRSHCHVEVQHSKQLALHEVQTDSKTMKKSGMFHFEGGWPKDINPRDEETTMRFRRRIEKDDNWAPKLRYLFQMMEHYVLQNGTVNIHEYYFDDMIPTPLVQPFGFRTVNLYNDPETSKRPVTNISWSPDSGSRIVVSYCFLDFGRVPDYSKKLYIWQVDNPNEPYMGLQPPTPCVCCEFNPRDPSVLASGLMTGQVCNWDIRTGNTPVQYSNLQYSHREFANAVKWLPSKSNTEFFSTSSDGCAMWWDTRHLQQPTEILMIDFENPNEPNMDHAIGVSCLNFGPMVGAKFMFGLENGVILTGSRKARSNAEKMAIRFTSHFGAVKSVDRNVFNPSIFMTVGDWRARIWAEDTREDCLLSTPFLREYPTGGCWNKTRHSVFYVTTASGQLLVWDILQTLREPVFTLQLCDEKLTSLAPCEENALLAIGNYVGKVFLVEPTDFFQSFDKKERGVLSECFDKCSKITKAVDSRLKEIKLTQKIAAEDYNASVKIKDKFKGPKKISLKAKDREPKSKTNRNRERTVYKEKKKIRDNGLQISEAERRYFDAVQQGVEAYALETNPDIIPVVHIFATTKKAEKKRKPSRSASVGRGRGSIAVEAKKTAKKIVPKEPIGIQKAERLTWKKPISLFELSVQRSIQSMREDVLPDLSLKIDKKTKKRKKRKRLFVLPRPCEGEICKPKVCCWRPSMAGRRKERPKEKKKSTLDKDSTVSIRSSTNGRRRRRMKGDVLREMRAPPTQLWEDVLKAKTEIQVAREMWKRPAIRLSVKARKRRPRKIRVVKKSTGDKPEESDKEEKGDIRTEESKEEMAKVRKAEVPDPCSPPPVKTTEELYSDILGTTPPQLQKERIVGRDYLETYARRKARVYPRISEFGQTK